MQWRLYFTFLPHNHDNISWQNAAINTWSNFKVVASWTGHEHSKLSINSFDHDSADFFFVYYQCDMYGAHYPQSEPPSPPRIATHPTHSTCAVTWLNPSLRRRNLKKQTFHSRVDGKLFDKQNFSKTKASRKSYMISLTEFSSNTTP